MGTTNNPQRECDENSEIAKANRVRTGSNQSGQGGTAVRSDGEHARLAQVGNQRLSLPERPQGDDSGIR